MFHAILRVLAACVRVGEQTKLARADQASVPEGSPMLPEFPAHTADLRSHINCSTDASVNEYCTSTHQ